MYSEEDEEYPAVYRGITQHLRAGSSDWNRRLNAYLTNHVAIRSALDQALMQSYNGGGRPGMPYTQNTMYPSGFMQHQHPQMMQQPQLMQHQLMPHPQQMMHSPHMIHTQNVASPQSQAPHVSLRQQPYPSPTGGHRNHGRSMSMHIPHQQGMQMPQYQQENAGINLNNRRSSIAVTPMSSLSLSMREQTPTQTTPGQMSPLQMSPPQTNPTLMSPAQLSPQMHSTQMTPQLRGRMPITFEQTVSPMPLQSPYVSPTDNFFLDFPLTNQLPPEAQTFLQPSLDPNDPLYASLMAGSYGNPTFGFDNGGDLKPGVSDTSSHGFDHLFDFSDVNSITQYPPCGSPQQGNFESPYCPPHSTAAIMLTPQKAVLPSRQTTSGDKPDPRISNEDWNSYLGISWVADIA